MNDSMAKKWRTRPAKRKISPSTGLKLLNYQIKVISRSFTEIFNKDSSATKRINESFSSTFTFVTSPGEVSTLGIVSNEINVYWVDKY